MVPAMILGGDIGGTKSLLGVFRAGPDRPQPSIVREYATADFDGLPQLVETFLDETEEEREDAANVKMDQGGSLADVNVDFLLALSAVIAVDLPLQFYATVTFTPAPGFSRFRLSSTARLLIVKLPAAAGVHE